MGIFVVFFSLFWAGIGLFMKKYPETISGYNTMPPEKKKNVDIQAVGNLMCKGFYVTAASMTTLYFLLRLLDRPIHTAVLGGVLMPIFFGTPVLIALAERYDKNPRSRFVKYLPAGIIGLLLCSIAAAIYSLYDGGW